MADAKLLAEKEALKKQVEQLKLDLEDVKSEVKSNNADFPAGALSPYQD